MALPITKQSKQLLVTHLSHDCLATTSYNVELDQIMLSYNTVCPASADASAKSAAPLSPFPIESSTEARGGCGMLSRL